MTAQTAMKNEYNNLTEKNYLNILDEVTKYAYNHGNEQVMDKILENYGLEYIDDVRDDISDNSDEYTKSEKQFVNDYSYDYLDEESLAEPTFGAIKGVIADYREVLNQ